MKIIVLIIVTSFCINTCVYAQEVKQEQALLLSANAGDAEAMYSLFVLLYERKKGGCEPTHADCAEAIKWLLQAGELNNWRAAFVLELCYRTGCVGLIPDTQKAMHFKRVYEEHRPAPEDFTEVISDGLFYMQVVNGVFYANDPTQSEWHARAIKLCRGSDYKSLMVGDIKPFLINKGAFIFGAPISKEQSIQVFLSRGYVLCASSKLNEEATIQLLKNNGHI
ncbi:sel1 repeat family protein [Pseudoalteromonas luteoviolacea]|uniref:Sel1 repeat family protein n=1 Tax=Pseudoalteromonas luteoviolacea S4060-1 TaxID=1365257 RepID=A0A167JB53_9GAMM|nr:sel1 repeat family protein [Pseudoalteromonas luteoviolacea]KZN60854.1 hypothetical protein N478_25960 [Pseudoalteromonas luteoviolacea S4060-1]